MLKMYNFKFLAREAKNLLLFPSFYKASWFLKLKLCEAQARDF